MIYREIRQMNADGNDGNGHRRAQIYFAC